MTELIMAAICGVDDDRVGLILLIFFRVSNMDCLVADQGR